MSKLNFHICSALSCDSAAVGDFILRYGQSELNYLPEDEIRAHVEKIKTGAVSAVVAWTRDEVQEIIGVVTYEIVKRYPQYQPEGRREEDHGYLAEAVVREDCAGQGVGSKLLKEAIDKLRAKGMKEIYAMRHADNVSSARMMEKGGMEIVDEFDDPEIRTTGSGRTAVCRRIVE